MNTSEVYRSSEKIQPLTVSLSETAQRGLFYSLYSQLVDETQIEVLYGWQKEFHEERVAQTNEVRKVAAEIIKNLGIMDGVSEQEKNMAFLYMGLVDLLPVEYLREWAIKEPVDFWDEKPIKYAKYFLDKKLASEE